MLSRIADTMYWMNRYLERAENYARFMDVNFNLSLESSPNAVQQWQPLVMITGDWPLYESLHKTVEKQKVIYFLRQRHYQLKQALLITHLLQQQHCQNSYESLRSTPRRSEGF